MDERRELMTAILMNPEEDTPRLVFADWLDEHDEPERAEFIRVQCELARLSTRDPAWAGFAERVAQLQRENSQRWLEPLAPFVPFVHHRLWFSRGLVAVVSFTEAEFVAPELQAVIADAFAAIGVESLTFLPEYRRRSLLGGLARFVFSGGAVEEFLRQDSVINQVVQSPALAWVAGLQLWGESASDDALRQLSKSPHVGHLSGLTLNDPKCTDTGLRSVAESAALPNLQRLTLKSLSSPGRFTNAGLRALLNSARLPRFDEWDVTGDLSARVTLQTLLSDPAAARLRRLGLGSADALAVVARTTHLTALESLWISGCHAVVTDREANEFL